jgi:hypothetical protein
MPIADSKNSVAIGTVDGAAEMRVRVAEAKGRAKARAKARAKGKGKERGKGKGRAKVKVRNLGCPFIYAVSCSRQKAEAVHYF